MRFRVYVEGELVADDWLGERNPGADAEAIADRHTALCRDAEAAGKLWHVEATDPGGETARWGTDPRHMHAPMQLAGPGGLGAPTPEALADGLARYLDGGPVAPDAAATLDPRRVN